MLRDSQGSCGLSTSSYIQKLTSGKGSEDCASEFFP